MNLEITGIVRKANSSFLSNVEIFLCRLYPHHLYICILGIEIAWRRFYVSGRHLNEQCCGLESSCFVRRDCPTARSSVESVPRWTPSFFGEDDMKKKV